MAKQSARDRANRLRSGCCPLHGLAMSQVGLTGDEARPFLVECTRKDCDIRGTSAEPYGEVFLLDDFRHLLGPRSVPG